MLANHVQLSERVILNGRGTMRCGTWLKGSLFMCSSETRRVASSVIHVRACLLRIKVLFEQEIERDFLFWT